MRDDLKKLVFHIKKSGLIEDMINYINREMPFTIFPKAYKENLTIDEHLQNIEDSSEQHTVICTGRISYDGVKSYLTYNANKLLEKYKYANLKVIQVKNLQNEEFVKKSFDIIFELDGVKIPLEVKVTQQTNGWTGATHSTNKVLDYLLISINIDRNKIVTTETKFVKGLFCMIYSFEKEKWVGEPSKQSSFTTLKLNSEVDYDDGIIIGGVKKNRKNCTILLENV